MEPNTIQLSSISMRLVLQAIIGSLRPSVFFECARCGSSITAQRTDGTSGSVSIVVTHGRRLNSSHSKHVAALTSAGNVSILCECGLYEPVGSADSGATDGTSFTPESSERELARLEHWANNVETLGAMLRNVCQEKETGAVVIASMIHARIVAEQFLEELKADGERTTEGYMLLERLQKALVRYLEHTLSGSGIAMQLDRVN